MEIEAEKNLILDAEDLSDEIVEVEPGVFVRKARSLPLTPEFIEKWSEITEVPGIIDSLWEKYEEEQEEKIKAPDPRRSEWEL